MNKELFVQQARDRFQQAKDFWRNWRVEAQDDYAFVSGNQWLAEDEAILTEQKRPPITFNYSEKMIDAVIGAEVSNRQEVRYAPRGMEDSPLAELWTNAAKWVRDECNAEDEESDAFKDMLICGMGWTQTRMSYDEDLDGKINIERVDPLEIYPDPAASKPGLSDRRWHFRLYWVDKREVKRNWPDAPMPEEEDNNTAFGVIQHGNRYEEGENDERERHKDQVQLRHYECYEFEPVYRVAVGQEIKELSESEFRQVKDELERLGVQYAKQRKRVYYRAFFAGETLLEMEKSPCQEGFTFQAITGKRDRNKNTWYGLTRVMKDPQRWANKWLSQILHIINTNAKGGLLAEIGAFVDPKKAQEEWSSPDSITYLNEGGINKVEQKAQAPYPHGLDKLMEFALSSLPMVTGINLEALGLANREQAGVLEAQRKQAAYGLLSPMFDAIRRYRKEQGRVLLYLINEYISDGRMVRIGGPESEQFLPLTKQEGARRFDIIVDQSPNAPDVKERTWESLVQILPAMMKAGYPVPPDILDFTPLPTTLAMKWKQFVGQQQQANQEMQQEMQKLKEENESLKRDQEIEMLELQQKEQQMVAEFTLKQRAQEEELRLERAKAEAEFEMEVWKMEREFDLEQRRAEYEAKMKKMQVDNDFRIKAFETGIMEDGDKEKRVSIGIDTTGFTGIMQKIAESHEQNSNAIAQAMAQVATALSRPRKLVTDQAGRPIGSEPVNTIQ